MDNSIVNARLKQNGAAFIIEKIRSNEAWFLFGLALITRLIALPLSQAIESDATSRLFLAADSLEHRGELGSLQWPALHIYFLAAAQFISNDFVSGPVFLSVLMGAFSVVPFYHFTKNIFSSKGAFFTALIFTFTPLIFRLSFVPLAEIYHVCFCMTALWLLSEGLLRKKRKWKWGMLAGISATIAAGGRFEAWVLMGLVGIILLVQKEWKLMFAFGFTAAIFPVWWMIYCYRATGHAFVSLELVEWQNFVVGKVNENITATEQARRIIFFPFQWLIACTPVVTLMSAWLYVKAIVKKKITRLQLLFGLLFWFFLPFFIYESITGSLADQARYTVTLIMLSLPAFALWFENPGKEISRQRFSVILALLLIPWSYTWHRLPWHIVFFGSYSEAIAEIVPATIPQTEAIPSFHRPGIKRVVQATKKYTLPGEGCLIDFIAWGETFYLAQQSGLKNKDLYIVSPVAPHNGDEGRLQLFFNTHPRGTILLSDFSALSKEQTFHGPLLEFNGLDGGLILSPVFTDQHIRVFRYSFLSPGMAKIQRIKYADAKPLFTPEKDIDYYKAANYGDVPWMAVTWKDALSRWRRLDKQVEANAKWLIENDRKAKAGVDTLTR